MRNRKGIAFSLLTLGVVGAGLGCNGPGSSAPKKTSSTASPVTSGAAPVGSGANPGTPHASPGAPPTGRVTPPPATPPTTGSPTIPLPVTPKPTPRFAFATGAGSATIQAFSVNPTTGALMFPASPLATVASPEEVVIAPGGKFAYTVSLVGPEIGVYSIDQTTGALTASGPTVSLGGGFGGSLLLHPNGKLAYVSSTDNIHAFIVDATTGALTPFAGNPILSSIGKTSAIDPAGRFVFCYGSYGGTGSRGFISLSIDPTTGLLKQVGTTPDYTYPQQLVCDPTGRFAYSADAGAGYIVVGSSPNVYAQGLVSEFVIDPVVGLQSNGVLNYSVNAGFLAQGLTVDPSGKYVYCVNETSGDIYSYSIDQKTGLLAVMGSGLSTADGTPTPTPAAAPGGFSTKSGANRVACDLSGKFVYVANWTSSTIAIFNVGPAGALQFSMTTPGPLFTSSIKTAP